MNVLATIIACFGLIENSAAVVIGAMLVAMLLGPISGIALALVNGDGKLLLKSLAAEVGGALLVLIVSFTIGKVTHNFPYGSQILSRTTPNILDLLIALAGGTAGAYATVTPKLRAGLVGVAVATALVPPLAVCGLCLSRGDMELAWGSFLLFFANLVAIQFAFSVVLGLLGFYKSQGDEKLSKRRALARQAVSVTLLVVLAVVLGNSFRQSVGRQQGESEVRKALTAGLKVYPGAELADLQFDQNPKSDTVTATVRASGAMSPAKVAALQALLPKMQGHSVKLRIRSIITKTATATGYVQNSSDSQKTTVPSGTDSNSASTTQNP